VKSLKILCKRFDLKKGLTKVVSNGFEKEKKERKQTYLTPNPIYGPPSFFFFSPPRPSSPLPVQQARQRPAPLPLPHVVTDRWGPHVGSFPTSSRPHLSSVSYQGAAAGPPRISRLFLPSILPIKEVKLSIHFPSINSVRYSSIKPFLPLEFFETAGHRHGH
jgi:hypothetical protein